ncbi:MAG: hypothetical protein LBN74_07900 [Prevotella sp.]|nr:hypothetical protein [Prevotella sp.]
MKDIKRNIVTFLMIFVLVLPFIMPGGLLPKRVLYKGELLVAYLDGVAGNMGWLTLYGNKTYEYNYAIVTHIKGNYILRNDTIYFDSPKGEGTYNFDYATLWDDKSNLVFGKDSIAYFHMAVLKNELIN